MTQQIAERRRRSAARRRRRRAVVGRGSERGTTPRRPARKSGTSARRNGETGGLRRPVEIPERPGEAVEVVLGAVVVPVNARYRRRAALTSAMRRSIFVDRLRDLRAPPLVRRSPRAGARARSARAAATRARARCSGSRTSGPRRVRALALELFHPFLNSRILHRSVLRQHHPSLPSVRRRIW